MRLSFIMSLIRAIILIFALLAQALPVSIWAQGDAPPECGMKCCDVGATSCCCAEPAQAPAAPASTPPTTGRELVPAQVWLEHTPFQPLKADAAEPPARFDTRSADIQPHVRLSVLFCAILI